MFPVLRRYHGYLPLPGGHSNGSGYVHSGRVVSVTACLLLGSVFLNVYILVSNRWAWTSAMDNYQHLNNHTFIDESAIPPLRHQEANPFENAVVTSLFTDSFVPAVLTLGHTLNAVNSTAARLLFYLPDQVSQEAVCIASAAGWTPQPIERIPPPRAGVHSHFLDQYSKLWLWRLDAVGVRAAVYLDADTLVRRNFDELFALPYAFAAVPDVRLDRRGFTAEFNAGVLFVRPDSHVFEDMLAASATAAYPVLEAEQAFLNVYFGMQALRLPVAYNANLAIKKRVPAMWADLLAEARVVHYTMAKPFLGGDYEAVPLDAMDANVEKAARTDEGFYAEEVREWGRQWRMARATYGGAIEVCQRRYAK